jgi:hypothetical protein
MKIAIMYNENEERSEKMKKTVVIFSVVALIVVFMTSCAMIDQRYTGKRIQVAPGESQYRDYEYTSGYDYYDPYYSYYYDPFFWTGLSIWNPFWHYGFMNYWSFGFGYSPYYWGYSPYYWGYYPTFWGSGYYYPGYAGRYYTNYRSGYRYVIRRNQLRDSRGRSVPSVRSRRSSRARISSGSRSSRTTVRRKK